MDLVNTIWSLVSSSWGCISPHAHYLRDLDKTLSSLKDAMDELKGIREDIRRKVTLVEQNPCMVLSQQVEDWLRKVGDVEINVDQILQKGDVLIHKSCLARCWPRTCISSYKLGKKGVEYLGIVNKMRDKGRFDVVGIEGPFISSSGGEPKTEGLREIPMDEKVVGMESAFDFAWTCLHDDSFRIIGLYGMGGVGKTTLLKKINNELFESNNRDFDLVIWIIASKQGKVGTIQDTILRKLNVPNKSWRDLDEQEKAELIHIFLQKRKFILMLDDLWEFLDPVKVGIRLSQTRLQKLVFTTRSEEVCGQMGAHASIKVRCLLPDPAWSLFQEKVGEATLNSHPEIPKLARIVAKECDGLPLALITIGRAMASRKKPFEWEHAIHMLEAYPSKFSGMANHVLPVLKYSYDSLQDEIVKACFLYCSIFPEDHEIINHDLVDLWIGEGYFNHLRGIHEARNCGLCIIETLKLACLVEEGHSEVLVKMHDVIRDMALWIACECGLKYNRFLVQEHFNSMEPHGVVQGWQEVEKLSLWGNDHVEKALESAHYPHLNTCLIRGALFTGLPRRFFQLASVIRVLDLSENRNLNKLPDAIGQVRTLEYLNISKTQVKCLPKELKNVTGLRYLLLDFMTCLEDIPADIISSFSDLRIFRMNYSCGSDIEALLDALEPMECICELNIYLPSPESSKKLMTSKKLQECLRNLWFGHCNGISTFELSSSKHLESLHIYNTPSLKHIQTAAHLRNLRCVIIYRCSQLINLNFLVFASNIQSLWVTCCESLQDLISAETESEGSANACSSLKRMRLDNLPCLKSIYPGVIASPSLEEVYVFNCPELTKIPFVPDDRRFRVIRSGNMWFSELKWDDECAKSLFYRQFNALAVSKYSRTHYFMIEQIWPESRDLHQTRAMDATPFDCLSNASRCGEHEQLLWSSTNM